MGPNLVRQALRSIGVERAAATPGHFEQAFPELRKRMAVYLDPVDLEERLAEIQGLLQLPGGRGSARTGERT